jgi:hypothetical protein
MKSQKPIRTGRKIFSSRIQAQGSAANWYGGITWAHRTRWRNYLVVKRQVHSFGQIVDLMRLWALFKSRGKEEIAGFSEGIIGKN